MTGDTARGPVLSVTGLRCVTPSGRVLLDNACLEVEAGRSAAVTGPSGSGKSTLLMCLLGLTRPERGAVRVAGTDITRLTSRKVARHRRETTGMVFQFGELLPELSPVENVALAALLAGTRRGPALRRASRLLSELGVPETGTATADLSGGERQRTAVARALINRPALLLADEPTGSLDPVNRDLVADLILSLPARWGCALVLVTHDPAVAARADRGYALEEGTLREQRAVPVARGAGAVAR